MGLVFRVYQKSLIAPTASTRETKGVECYVTPEATNCPSSLQQDADSILSPTPEGEVTGLAVINSTYADTNSASARADTSEELLCFYNKANSLINGFNGES